MIRFAHINNGLKGESIVSTPGPSGSPYTVECHRNWGNLWWDDSDYKYSLTRGIGITRVVSAWPGDGPVTRAGRDSIPVSNQAGRPRTKDPIHPGLLASFACRHG
ncbi:hypothetical protein ElyMa_001774700 [Elysia marginata]|uniref:Uncharacterized protein n=1 Tax=Elysia marginata TaxID=1093978 RepID=A0AAV4ECC0_9GAST|nr:hypothetical protein ElyMa_001774700 [Elysia marginata]